MKLTAGLEDQNAGRSTTRLSWKWNMRILDMTLRLGLERIEAMYHPKRGVTGTDSKRREPYAITVESVSERLLLSRCMEHTKIA